MGKEKQYIILIICYMTVNGPLTNAEEKYNIIKEVLNNYNEFEIIIMGGLNKRM